MHCVGADYVSQLQDLLVGQVVPKGVEHAIGDPTVLDRQGVGEGQDGPLGVVEAIGCLPRLDGSDLLVGDADGATGLAVLGVDEPATHTPANPGLAKFSELRVEQAPGTPVQGKSRHGMVEHVGNQGKGGPPVTRSTRRGAGLVDRVPVAEQQLEDRLGSRMKISPTDLPQPCHSRMVGLARRPVLSRATAYPDRFPAVRVGSTNDGALRQRRPGVNPRR